MVESLDYALLRLTKGGQLPTRREVERVCSHSHAKLRSRLCELRSNDPQGHLASGHVTFGFEHRLRLAQTLLREGVDPERVAECLRWQEFEHFAESGLRQYAFRTKRHFVFKHSGGKHEIDLMGWRDNMLLCIDCKRWDYGWSPSRIRSAVEAQRLRVHALAREPSELVRVMPSWEGAYLLPVMVGLRTTDTKIVEGTPVVPILRLGSFLSGVNLAVEGLCFEEPRISPRLNSWVS